MTNKICILNYWWAANYGANLTAYALQQLIDNSVLVDNSDWSQWISEEKQGFHLYFAEKYLLTTPVCRKVSDFIVLNNMVETFIVGSDQVFRKKTNRKVAETFLLDFATPDKKKIAFSASFGVDKENFLKETDSKVIQRMKESLKSFDCISVREKQGVEICKDLFGVDAEWIIDPVFILDSFKYKELAGISKKKKAPLIASCMFMKKDKKIDKFLTEKYGYRVVELHNSKYTIEDWLNTIKTCEFLITNSYHAMCFAVIFNKPFICLSKDMGAASRFESLFEMLGIENQSIDSIEEIYSKDCIFKIDYEKVNKRIAEERERGLLFLKKALDAPAGKYEEKQKVRTRFLEEKLCQLEQQATLAYQIKKSLWNLWLIIFYKFLPEPLKTIIRKLRDMTKCK